MQRLQILWHMAYYGIPRSRVKEHFLIAKSTLYRWLHAAQEGDLGDRKARAESAKKTRSVPKPIRSPECPHSGFTDARQRPVVSPLLDNDQRSHMVEGSLPAHKLRSRSGLSHRYLSGAP